MDAERGWTRKRAGLTAKQRRVEDAPQTERRLYLARWIYWMRETRPELDIPLFGEPAWDLLLDLYVRQKTGSRSSVTSACIGSRAPHTTALRHVSALCDAGWLERVVDDADRRRNWLSLTEEAESKLDRYFDRLLATLDHGAEL